MKVFVYGTLKRGFFNHRRMEVNKGKFLGEAVVPGYTMYSLLFYPIIVPTPQSKNTVTGEIYDVDIKAYASIKKMELSSGYREVNLTINGQAYKAFVQDKPPFNAKEIKDGIWTLDEENSVFSNIKVDKDSLKEQKDDFKPYISNDWSDDDSNDVWETDFELYDLVKEYPKLINDEEVFAYICKSKRVQALINSNPKLRRAWQDKLAKDEDDIYNLSLKDVEDIESLMKRKEEKPLYPIDDDQICMCHYNGVTPNWKWDSAMQAWRCEKCGEFQ